jgi:hypothetical protein
MKESDSHAVDASIFIDAYTYAHYKHEFYIVRNIIILLIMILYKLLFTATFNYILIIVANTIKKITVRKEY